MIRCKYHEDGTYGHNYTCIPFEKRLEKKQNGTDHPCPFKDFGECKEWMEGEKFELLWKIWLKKYDPGGFDSAGFYKWSRRLANISPEYVWQFMKNKYPYLQFIGYETVSWTPAEKIKFKLELLDFQALNRDPPQDCCINEGCSSYCPKYIVCPMIHYRKEILAMGVPDDIKKTRSYTRWKWHLNKSNRIRSGKEHKTWGSKSRKEDADTILCKVIWFSLRELTVGDFATASAIKHRGFNNYPNQDKLNIKIDEI